MLAGCVVGPRYRPPDSPLPERFADSAGTPSVGMTETDSKALEQWWKRFDDATLDSLIQRGLETNLDLQSAASRIRQAREAVVVAGAARWPQLDASAIALRAHANSNPFMRGASLDLREYSLGFDATWELDLFGATRHAIDAARAQAEGAIWQYRDTSVSLSAEIASNYLSLREVQARRALLRTSIDRERQLLDLVAARAQAGFTSELDVDQQRTQLYAVSAALPPLDAEESALVHSLGVLLAQPPDTLAEELRLAQVPPAVPARLPLGLPSELLRRRPDVRLAERRFAVATAQTGVAVANLYPKFDLLGLVSFANSSLADLLSRKSLSTAGLGRITWPVFSAGRARAAVRESEEAQTQAYLSYRKAVLAALQDVEDALGRFTADQARVQALDGEERAAQDSFAIAQQQYANGTVTYINVLQAENSLLQAQEQTTESRQVASRDLVALYKALGGGWESAAGDAAKEDTRLRASEAARIDQSKPPAGDRAAAPLPH